MEEEDPKKEAAAAEGGKAYDSIELGFQEVRAAAAADVASGWHSQHEPSGLKCNCMASMELLLPGVVACQQWRPASMGTPQCVPTQQRRPAAWCTRMPQVLAQLAGVAQLERFREEYEKAREQKRSAIAQECAALAVGQPPARRCTCPLPFLLSLLLPPTLHPPHDIPCRCSAPSRSRTTAKSDW